MSWFVSDVVDQVICRIGVNMIMICFVNGVADQVNLLVGNFDFCHWMVREGRRLQSHKTDPI